MQKKIEKGRKKLTDTNKWMEEYKRAIVLRIKRYNAIFEKSMRGINGSLKY